MAALIVLPYLAFFVATLHISDYVSYRDVFHAGETLAPIGGARKDADVTRPRASRIRARAISRPRRES